MTEKPDEQLNEDSRVQHEALVDGVSIKTGPDSNAICKHCAARFAEGVPGVCPARALEMILGGFVAAMDKAEQEAEQELVSMRPSKTPTQEVKKTES